MAKKLAPPSATGAAGTIFEYRLAAVVFGKLLCGLHAPVGFRLPIGSIGLQQAASGLTLDDIVIAAGLSLGGPLVQIQVKKTIAVTGSDRYFQDFLAAAVEAVQDRRDDIENHGMRLCLATAGTLGAESRSLKELQDLADLAWEHPTSPAGFAEVLGPKSGPDALRKRLTHIKTALSKAVPQLPAEEIDAMTHRILACLHVWVVSIGPDGADERRILDELVPLLPGDGTRANDVFSHLCELAQECGSHGGTLTAQSLREKLFAKHGVRLSPPSSVKNAPAAFGTRPVCQLPPTATHFKGRLDELEALQACGAQTGRGENGNPTVAAVVGRPGVGKTALALRLAHDLRSDYEDGQLFVDLRGASDCPAEPTDVLGGFLRALGIENIPEDTAERAALYRSALADRRVMVVLDNASDYRQIEQLLPGAGPSLVIVTSRNTLVALHASTRLVLDALADHEAVDLLCSTAGKPQLRQDPFVEEIARLCGQLPLALRIAGSALANWGAWSTAELARSLRDETARLDQLSPEDEIGVRACIALSYRRLPAAVRRAFRLLSAIPAPQFPRALSIAALGASERESLPASLG
jgi:NB-ARC domain